MIENNELLLEKYLQLPDRLASAIAGLNDADLNLKLDDGWSIRQIVHHLVDGESLWQVNLRAAAGMDGIFFPFQWYFAISQDEWAKRWAYDKRPLEPQLALFRASTWNLVEFLRNIPDAWEHYGRVIWPDRTEETRLTVRQIVEIHLNHMDGHAEDIRTIRALHHI